MSVWRQYTLSICNAISDREDKREKNVWVNVRAWWRRSVTNRKQLACGPGQRGRDGWLLSHLGLASKWGWFQGMCQFGFPFQSLDSLGIIYPFPSSLVGFVPVVVEANDIHLIKMHRGWRRGYCDHIFCDGTSYARCSKGKEGMAEGKEGVA